MDVLSLHGGEYSLNSFSPEVTISGEKFINYMTCMGYLSPEQINHRPEDVVHPDYLQIMYEFPELCANKGLLGDPNELMVLPLGSMVEHWKFYEAVDFGSYPTRKPEDFDARFLLIPQSAKTKNAVAASPYRFNYPLMNGDLLYGIDTLWKELLGNYGLKACTHYNPRNIDRVLTIIGLVPDVEPTRDVWDDDNLYTEPLAYALRLGDVYAIEAIESHLVALQDRYGDKMAYQTDTGRDLLDKVFNTAHSRAKEYNAFTKQRLIKILQYIAICNNSGIPLKNDPILPVDFVKWVKQVVDNHHTRGVDRLFELEFKRLRL